MEAINYFDMQQNVANVNILMVLCERSIIFHMRDPILSNFLMPRCYFFCSFRIKIFAPTLVSVVRASSHGGRGCWDTRVSNSRNPKVRTADFSLLCSGEHTINWCQRWRKRRGGVQPWKRRRNLTLSLPQPDKLPTVRKRADAFFSLLHPSHHLLFRHARLFHIHTDISSPLISLTPTPPTTTPPTSFTFPLILPRVQEAPLTSQPAWQQPINYDWQVFGPIKAAPYFMHSKSDCRLLRRVAADMFIVIMAAGRGLVGAPQH